ncbi:universal stress protein [Clostridium gasigenes]|uniref:Universal stress protein n=1 Tax=Clostridium gasigenes TaxID=94869 RepID=A0A7X0SDW8_9CLOT|nr:universal stress protein [Clostridium gasigenes]MBB6715744.1 universal stress protein [Clostridium gasigenes]
MDKKRANLEQALNACKKETTGLLKVFLGYAPGVGKTYTMLNEANRRFKRGEDIVIGYFESHGRQDTIDQLKDLPQIPLKDILYNNITLTEMNLEEILKRKPKLVIIDELAHTNAPGSKNRKRYEDVLEILNCGINVYTTVNLQHLESLNDVIRQITGVNVNETVPDIILEDSEVVVIDITPDSLRNRLQRGNIYKEPLIERSLSNFFRKGNLTALRELTLRQTADEVDEALEEYKINHDIHENWSTVERVMVSISSSHQSQRLIRMGSVLSKKYKCAFYVVYVDCTHRFSPADTPNKLNTLNKNILLAESLNATVKKLKGRSVSKELVKFAHDTHITKLIIGHSKRTTIQKFFRGSTINKLLNHSKNIQIIVVPYE